MKSPDNAESSQFQVIINYEGRYFVWPLDTTLPGGWRFEGKTGTRKECLHYLLELWRIRTRVDFQQLFMEQGV